MKLTKIISLILILIAPSLAAAKYTDERFSIKGVPTYVNLMDEATDGCWTNIGEVRNYIEDKLAENGAVILDDTNGAGVVFNFQVLAKRTSGFCYGSMSLSLAVGANAGPLKVIGSLYRKNSITINQQNFNISALNWLGKRLPEID